MEISAQDIVDRLTRKIAKLESDNVVMEVQIETLQRQIQDMASKIPQDGQEVIEGDAVGG